MNRIVWLASYPKSGNTWFRVFLANLRKDGERPVDINELDMPNFASRREVDRRLGWETSDLSDEEFEATRLDLQDLIATDTDAVLKIHEAYRNPKSGQILFSRNATRAVLYFIRNPLDVAISFSHHLGCTVDQAITKMATQTMVLAPSRKRPDPQLFQPLNTWSQHVLGWLDESGFPVHAIRYEDMLQKPQETFTKACAFAGFPTDPDRIHRALEHSRFENLRKQESQAGFRESLQKRPFFRKGQAGGWREVLSAEQVDAIVRAHGDVMQRFGYLNPDGSPA